MSIAVTSAISSAEGISVRGGLIMGNWNVDADAMGLYAGGVGIYLGGTASMPGTPYVFSGSFTTFSSDELKVKGGGEGKVDSNGRLFKLFAGYQLPQYPIAVGGGYVSQVINLNNSSDSPVSGLAVVAFGSMPVADNIVVSGEFFYSPFADADGDKANGLGLEISGTYQVKDQISVEAGYRLSRFTDTEVPGDATISVNSLYAGGRYSF